MIVRWLNAVARFYSNLTGRSAIQMYRASADAQGPIIMYGLGGR